MAIKNEDIAVVFKALSDPRRIQIVKLLQDGEKCANVLIEGTGMPQSTLSYHMKVLCRSGCSPYPEKQEKRFHRPAGM